MYQEYFFNHTKTINSDIWKTTLLNREMVPSHFYCIKTIVLNLPLFVVCLGCEEANVM